MENREPQGELRARHITTHEEDLCMRRSVAALAVAALALTLAVSSLGFALSRPDARAAAKAHVVKIVSISGGRFAFHPATIKIKVGQTVTWKNTTSATHTATADNFTAFDTGFIASGSKATHKFKKAGTFKYHCNVHTYMKGTVKVVK
jgi:plastocyanin